MRMGTRRPAIRHGPGGRGRQVAPADYATAVSQHGIRVLSGAVAPDGRRVIGADPLSEPQRVLGV